MQWDDDLEKQVFGQKQLGLEEGLRISQQVTVGLGPAGTPISASGAAQSRVSNKSQWSAGCGSLRCPGPLIFLTWGTRTVDRRCPSFRGHC